MSKKCIYCKAEIEDDCVIDFCDKCGVQTFGQKMFDAIVNNMEDARARGDLLFQSSLNSKEFIKG